MVTLNLDDAVFRGSAGAAMTLQLLGDILDLARVEPGHDAHRTGAPSFAQDAYDTVVGNAPCSRHVTRFGRRERFNCPSRTR